MKNTPQDTCLKIKNTAWSKRQPKSRFPPQVTLKYTGSTLCLIAWAFPTRASTDDTFSGSWRFSTTLLMAFITLQACCRSWLLRSISSGSSRSWNWLKYCLADGKLTKNLKRQIISVIRIYNIYCRIVLVLVFVGEHISLEQFGLGLDKYLL